MQIKRWAYKAYIFFRSSDLTSEVTHRSNLDKDTVDGFVEAIKARIIDEGLYDNETATA